MGAALSWMTSGLIGHVMASAIQYVYFCLTQPGSRIYEKLKLRDFGVERL